MTAKRYRDVMNLCFAVLFLGAVVYDRFPGWKWEGMTLSLMAAGFAAGTHFKTARDSRRGRR
jgi:hypothetical protein